MENKEESVKIGDLVQVVHTGTLISIGSSCLRGIPEPIYGVQMIGHPDYVFFFDEVKKSEKLSLHQEIELATGMKIISWQGEDVFYGSRNGTSNSFVIHPGHRTGAYANFFLNYTQPYHLFLIKM